MPFRRRGHGGDQYPPGCQPAGNGYPVDWAVAAPFTIAALLGVSVGKAIADRLPTVTLVRWFVGLLVVLAVYVATRAGLALVGA